MDHKPCPFCGSRYVKVMPNIPFGERVKWRDIINWAVICGDCKASTRMDITADEAWKLWDKRPTT